MTTRVRPFPGKRAWFLLSGLALLVGGLFFTSWRTNSPAPTLVVDRSSSPPDAAGAVSPEPASLAGASWIMLPAGGQRAGGNATISLLKPLGPVGAGLHDAAAIVQSGAEPERTVTEIENDPATGWVIAPVANEVNGAAGVMTTTMLRPGASDGSIQSWPPVASPASVHPAILPAPASKPNTRDLLIAPRGDRASRAARTELATASATFCISSPSPLPPGANRAAGGRWPMLLTTPVVEMSCPVQPLIWPEFLYGSPGPEFGDRSLV